MGTGATATRVSWLKIVLADGYILRVTALYPRLGPAAGGESQREPRDLGLTVDEPATVAAG